MRQRLTRLGPRRVALFVLVATVVAAVTVFAARDTGQERCQSGVHGLSEWH